MGKGLSQLDYMNREWAREWARHYNQRENQSCVYRRIRNDVCQVKPAVVHSTSEGGFIHPLQKSLNSTGMLELV